MRARVCLFVACLFVVCEPTASGSVCGNGFVEGGEECDDANVRSGDGCSPGCVLEDPTGTEFLCGGVSMVGGGVTTQCCRAHLNPVTGQYVCSCAGQTLGTTRVRLADDCSYVDVDECASANGGCAANALCVNTDGREGPPGYACVCPPGFFGDGFLECRTSRYGVTFELEVESLPPGDGPLEWIEGNVIDYVVAELPGEGIEDVTVSGVEGGGARRRLLQEAYTHVAVVLEVADWDTMQGLVEEVNAVLIAEYLTGQSGDLYQFSVLQETTTLVEEAPSQYTFTVVGTPGFVVVNVSHAAVPGEQWSDVAHVWRVGGHFYAPEGIVHALFVTDSRAAVSPAEHACATSTDVCCLHRMREGHLLGEFGTWVAENISPFCTDPGEMPNATARGRTTAEMLGELPRTRWVEGVFGALPNSSVAVSDTGGLTFDISQADVSSGLAASTPFGEGTRYSFALGMLFFHPLDAPALHAVVGQAAIEVFSNDAVSFVASSEQQYSFLEYLDLTLYEIEYRPEVGERHLLQFVRVLFLVPEEIRAAEVPGDAVQYALGPSAAEVGTWVNPCFSSSNVTARDGSGAWDDGAVNSSAALFNATAVLDCVPSDLSFCASTAFEPETGLMILDVPLGDTVLREEEYVFLRFVVRGESNTTDEGLFEVLTQVNTQIYTDPSTIMPLCPTALTSEVLDTDYTEVSIGVGLQMTPVEGDERDAVILSDVMNSVGYADAGALDVGEAYRAVSVLDSLLTVAVLGLPSFFEQPAQAAHAVVYDHVITIHLRDDDKYASVAAMLASDTAYTRTRKQNGYHEITLAPALLEVCHGPGGVPDPTPDENLDCAVRTPVYDGVVAPGLAHLVAPQSEEDVVWFIDLFGDSEFLRETGQVFSEGTRELFGLNERYRRALWVLPTYPWPGRTALQTADRTVVLTAFSVRP